MPGQRPGRKAGPGRDRDATAAERGAAHRAGDTVSAEEHRFERFVDLAPDGIVVVDAEGRIVLANAQAHRLFAYEPGELVGRSVDALLPEAARPAHASHRAAYAANPRTRPMGAGLNLVGLRKDGSEMPVEVSLSPFESSADGLLVMAAIRDITDRRRAEAQIRTLNEDLRHRLGELHSVNRELEAFSYSVSHDLRAPLRAIDGFSQILLEDHGERLDPEGQDYLARIRAAAGRMGELIDDLLELSRVTRRQMHREPVDLSALARTVVEQLARAEPDRALEVVIAPGIRAEGDPHLLRIVLENLFGNAWKFTRGCPGARVELATEALEDGGVAYVVRDNGVGFDMTYAGKLFGAFQRLHSAAEFPGTGIGLATVQRIVSRHGGRVWAHGEPGQGAVFSFTLREEA